MKKIITVVVLSLISQLSWSQDEVLNESKNSVGLKGGLNIASLTSSDDSELDSRIAFHAGLYVEFPISEKLSIQPEVVFSSQGGREKTFTESASSGFESFFESDTKLRLNYINIPVLAKYYIVDGFSVQVGPQIGFLVSARAEFEINSSSNSNNSSISGNSSVKDEFNSVDLSAAFGLGYKFDGGFNLSARYNLGFSEVFKNQNQDENRNDIDVRNSVFQFSIGYTF
jgi:opacity protein-like surface antigen